MYACLCVCLSACVCVRMCASMCVCIRLHHCKSAKAYTVSFSKHFKHLLQLLSTTRLFCFHNAIIPELYFSSSYCILTPSYSFLNLPLLLTSLPLPLPSPSYPFSFLPLLIPQPSSVLVLTSLPTFPQSYHHLLQFFASS